MPGISASLLIICQPIWLYGKFAISSTLGSRNRNNAGSFNQHPIPRAQHTFTFTQIHAQLLFLHTLPNSFTCLHSLPNDFANNAVYTHNSQNKCWIYSIPFTINYYKFHSSSHQPWICYSDYSIHGYTKHIMKIINNKILTTIYL